MSRFAVPNEPMSVRTPARAGQSPASLQSANGLLMYPLAGAAAFSALGLGLACHVIGMWIGASSTAMDLSRHLLAPHRRGGPAAPQRPTPAQRAESAARALIDGVSSAGAKTSLDAAKVGRSSPDATPSDRHVSATARTQSVGAPKEADDLKAISGIGPKLAGMLNGLGIRSYRQIASWSREDVTRLDGQLSFSGRIDRDDWVGQAKRLVQAAGKPESLRSAGTDRSRRRKGGTGRRV